MFCAYKKSGIKNFKITHNKVSGCKGADENGIQEAQILLFFICFFYYIINYILDLS